MSTPSFAIAEAAVISCRAETATPCPKDIAPASIFDHLL